MELHDVTVVQPAHDGDLAFDIRHQIGAVDFLFVDDFDGDALSRTDIARVVDFGEGAASEEFADFVFAEEGVFVWEIFDLWHNGRR